MVEEKILREVISMIVTVNKNELMKIIGKTLSLKKLEDTLFLMKAEIERIDGNEIRHYH